MYLQKINLNTKNVIRSRCHFETAIFKEFFLFINFMFVTRK